MSESKTTNVFSKYGKIIAIAILSVLLSIAIVLLYKAHEDNRKYQEYVDLQNEILKKNNEVYAKNLKVLQDFQKQADQGKVIIVTTKEFYERVKKSPTNTKYTDAELIKWVNSYQSDYGADKSK